MMGRRAMPSAINCSAFFHGLACERVGHKAPEEIVFLDAIPLNPTGKIDRVTLKKLAAGDHAYHT